MVQLSERYVIDKDGNRVAVQLDIQDYQNLLAEVESARAKANSFMSNGERPSLKGIAEPTATYTVAPHTREMPQYVGQRMNFEDMEQYFEGEWVLLGELETTSTPTIISAIILWHSPDRDDVYAKMMEIPMPRETATWYFRSPADSTIILL